jgi:hypothetical protein
VFGPNDPRKVCYLLVSREQYDEAMAIVNQRSSDQVEHRSSRLVLHDAEWRNNHKVVIVELGDDR